MRVDVEGQRGAKASCQDVEQGHRALQEGSISSAISLFHPYLLLSTFPFPALIQHNSECLRRGAPCRAWLTRASRLPLFARSALHPPVRYPRDSLRRRPGRCWRESGAKPLRRPLADIGLATLQVKAQTKRMDIEKNVPGKFLFRTLFSTSRLTPHPPVSHTGPSLSDISGMGDAHLTPKLNSFMADGGPVHGSCRDCSGEATARDTKKALICLRSVLNNYEPDKQWKPIQKVYFNFDKRNGICKCQSIQDGVVVSRGCADL